MTEDEMVGWHLWLNGHEFEQVPGVGDGQGGLACYNPWSCRVRQDGVTKLNWTELNWTEFTLIHRPNIPGSYVVLFYIASSFTFSTRYIHNWVSFLLWQSHFSPVASFFLEWWVIALCSSSVAFWRPSVLGGSSSDVISFCLFIVYLGLSQQAYWRGLPFPPLVDLILSELFTITYLSWVALHGMAHSFIELHRPLCHEKAVVLEGAWPE